MAAKEPKEIVRLDDLETGKDQVRNIYGEAERISRTFVKVKSDVLALIEEENRQLKEVVAALEANKKRLLEEIDRRKALERALSRHNDRLEETVARRTGELEKSNRELRQYQEHLESLVEEESRKRREKEQMLLQQNKMAGMGEMIGAIAHQWKQPLNILALSIQELEDSYQYGELDEKRIRQIVEEGMGQIHHMSKTITDFRNFFRPVSEEQRFTVREAVEEVLELAGAQLEKGRIRVVMEMPEPGTVRGHPNEFKQALLNILGNSRDAITERQGKEPKFQGIIRIALEEKGGEVILRIADNGGGFPPEMEARLFEPYFTTKAVEGTGIGLSIVRTILEQKMGGGIRGENLEEGACFTITLNKASGQ